MAISFIVVGLFIVFLILFIIYKLVLCPQTPSNVQCDWQDARVVITWDPQSRNATYQIFYRTKNNSNARWCILPDLYINTYALSIVNGISYEIEVKAKNSFGTSWLANTVSGCSRAPAPENLSVSHSANKSDSISLRWAMVTNCNGYIIKRTTCLENGIFTYMKRIDDSMITNFEDTSFTFGIKYYYKVVSMDRAGESSQPNLVSVLPRAPPPSDLIVSYDECMVNCIKLQWKPVLNCHGYAIQRGAKPFSSDEQTCIKQIRNSTVNSTEDTSFIFGLTYYYVVVSLDQAGESNRSNIASICPRAPASNDLVASYDENGGSFISLHWEPVPNCEGYIMKKLKSSFRGMLIIQTFDVSSDTRMNDASLTFGITYYYHVVSVDRAGESKRSNQVKVCPRAPSPKDLTVSYDQDKCTSIIIQWKPVTNCEGYVVQRMMDRSHDKVTTIKRLNSSSVTKTVDTSFTFGVVYTYTVVSLDQIGESGRSKLVSVCPRVPAAKGLAISFDDQTNSSINLSWEPVKNCKCYIVRRAENTSTGSYSTISRLCSPLETKITDNMFTFGIRYYYIVLSVDQAGESAESKVVSIFPRAPPPSNVIVSFENQDDYFILLQWEPLSSAQGYIIKRMSDDPDEFITTRRVKNSSITSIEDRCFTFGVTYRYIVTSLDQAGESDRSTEVSLCSRIPPPKNLTVITPKDVSGTIVIEWTSMPKSNGYCIYRAQTSDFIKETVVETITEPTTRSYTDSDLQNGIDYWYRIASIDTAGVSLCSEAVCKKAILPSPTNLSAVVLHDQNAILIEWTGVSSACGYRIERKNNLNSFTTIGYVHDTSITKFIDMKNVLTDIQYSYIIYALDETSESLPTCDSVTATVLRSKQQQKMTYSLEVKLGDLVTEKVDAVVVCSTSDELMKTILKTSSINAKDIDRNRCITKPAGHLPCRTLIFNPWTSDQTSEYEIRESLRQFVSITMQQAAKVGCNTLAYPAIGCGRFNCDTKTVAEAMISEAYHQFQLGISSIKRVSFIIEQQKQIVYDTFQQYHKLKEYFFESRLRNDGLPLHWGTGNNTCPERVNVQASSEEYQIISHDFISSMSAVGTVNVVRIERIQNERLYRQHLIEKKYLDDILKQDTQHILYHGCANDNKTLQSIIEHGFDQSRAGKAHGKMFSFSPLGHIYQELYILTGTWYGHGVYFSSKATESHRYVKPHRRTRQCVMFLCSVLVGKSTLGNSDMHVCPEGYHSTTDDSSSIYVVYRDARAYTNYLIFYK